MGYEITISKGTANSCDVCWYVLLMLLYCRIDIGFCECWCSVGLKLLTCRKVAMTLRGVRGEVWGQI